MPFTNHHRKWRKARGRARSRQASLTQQTRKTRWHSYHRSARHQEPSISGWSSDSSDESFKCAAPNRHPKRRQDDQQQLSQRSSLTPAAEELERAADGGTPQADSSTSTMEQIRFMEVVAEVDKAVGIATTSSSSPSSSDLDHHTFYNLGSISKDGQAGIDSSPATIIFSSPTPYHNTLPAQLTTDGQEGTEELHFNVDIFKSPGETPRALPTELPKATSYSSDLQEELHAERWECLQQLERRATEASLEGLRKASLKGDNTERTQSISSGGHDPTHSTTLLHKHSRQTVNGSNKSSSKTSHLWGSNESHKMEAKEVSTQANPMITLSYHPIGADETLRKEKLLLRSPSVSVAVPILEKVDTIGQSKAPSHYRPVGPRPMSKTSNLTRLSEASVQTDENDMLIPLSTRAAPRIAPADPDVTEVIAIPSSAVRQMVRTSHYLRNRKNSTGYYANPVIHNISNWSYQDDLNNSSDDVTQPSLIEISLNKVNGEIGSIGSERSLQKVAVKERAGTQTRAIDIPGGGSRNQEARISAHEGSVRSSGSAGGSRFRRLSIGDGPTAPRDKRYKYMKTHPALPPQGPSSVLPQLIPKDVPPAPPPKPSPHPSRVRSVSLGESRAGYQQKLPKIPGSPPTEQVPAVTSPSLVQEGVGLQQKDEDSRTRSDGKGWCHCPTTKSWNDFTSQDWPTPPRNDGRHATRAEKNPSRRMDGCVPGRQERHAEQLYQFAGVKSQSEPSLGFLASSGSHHPHHQRRASQHQHRKLRKRSQLAFDLNHSEPVPPLPPLPSLTTPTSGVPPHPNHDPFHPIHHAHHHQHHHSQSKNRNFLTQIKLFWKNFIAPHPSPIPPHHPHPLYHSKTSSTHPETFRPNPHIYHE
ncbi:hypothetical protein PCANC_03335 [Puccinia coronata f. sp. avenae]|uniref:Uncharacterized protein n=1 Tax=Puccinia coronata f. sp. avenae TaxID=200324 RepID=A0A2N5T8Q9_9BASI|nr:hypothetical protein PCANC_03335 [Puccinia coronata f. sp. avenae]